MTGSPKYASLQSLVCCICGSPVLLEKCNTDESGSIVHEECYVRRTISAFRTVRVVQVPKKWLSWMGVRFHSSLRVTDKC